MSLDLKWRASLRTFFMQIYYVNKMISKSIKYLCNEDISLIENYNKAIKDNTQTWECHHKLETELNVNRQYLIDNNLYYKRPASELIFLKHKDHIKLHKKNTGLSHRIPVLQYDLQDNFIREFDSFVAIKKYLKRDICRIGPCCSGKIKEAYGYKWKYKYPSKTNKSKGLTKYRYNLLK